MGEERPFVANYVIGLLIAMAVHMSYQVFAALVLYDPDIPEMILSNRQKLLFTGVIIWDSLLVAGLLLNSGIAYKVAIVTQVILITTVLWYMINDNDIAFYIGLEIVLSTLCLILLLFPSMRRFYKGWTLPKMKKWEIEV